MNSEAFEVLDKIGDLYKLERKLKKAGAVERHSMRQLHAVSVLNDIFVWCRERREKFLPKEPITDAIQYALNHESALRRYCEDPVKENSSLICQGIFYPKTLSLDKRGNFLTDFPIGGTQ